MSSPRTDQERDPAVVSDDARTVLYEPIKESTGARIGPYKLLQEIGHGGFGVVYMAEQIEPVRRKVALKIIKPGMDTKEVIARFESERQALALMDHPNIARVLDAGATDSGRPYFVMELVKGVPITEFCDTNNMATEARLELIVTVCHAVQHAHQKGIIHRDLKPSNIMVTLHDGKPVPKVIDFGVAKATNQQLTEHTLFTKFGQMIGTPAYVSPEQAEMSGLDIDTRSDIYSLGVVLYELLTGSTPFDSRRLRQAGIVEMQRIIREEHPPLPSTRLSTLGDSASVVGSHRCIDLKRLGTLLKGELDWIVMKSLEKERGRRYSTPNDFAADIERFLRREPIMARPPSATYRLRKFVQRNTAAVCTAVLILLALVLATAISTVQAIRANREAARAVRAEKNANELFAEAKRHEQLAEKRRQDSEKLRRQADLVAEQARLSAAEAKAISNFLQVDVLAQANPQWQSDRGLTMRAVLDRAAGRIGGKFEQQPLAEASLQFTIGHAYEVLGEFDRAEPHLRRSLELRRRELGESHRETIVSMSRLTYLLRDKYRLDEAEQLARQLIALNTETHGPDHLETLTSKNIFVWNLHLQGRAVEAETLGREILALRQILKGDESVSTLDSRNILSKVIQPLGKLEEAEALARQVLQVRKDRLGVKHPYFLQAMFDLGGILQLRGNLDEAMTIASEAHTISRRVMGDQNPRTLLLARLVAQIHFDQGDTKSAVQLLESALAAGREVFGTDHPETISIMAILATVLTELERFPEAEQLAQFSAKSSRQWFGPGHPETLRYCGVLGDVYLAQNKHDLAAPILEPLADTAKRELPAQHRYLPIAIGQLGALRLAQGRIDEAEGLLRESFVGRTKVQPGASETHRAAALLASALVAQARLFRVTDPAATETKFLEAESLLLASHAAMKSQGTSTRRANVVQQFVELYSAWEKPAEAAKWRE